MQKPKLLPKLLLIGLIMSVVWFWYIYSPNWDLNLPSITPTLEQNKPLIIFTTRWWQPDFPYLSETNSYCPKCHFTQNESLWDSSSNIGAVVFHATFLNPQIPKRRTPNELWVFMFFEALTEEEVTTSGMIKEYDNLFNLTMTYRSDSNIFVPYGRFNKLSDKPRPDFNQDWAYSKGANGLSTYDGVKYKVTPSVKDFHNRSMVAWIAARCHSPNSRELIISQLRAYNIPIDIYGPCGPFVCNVPKSQALSGVDCRVQIYNKYKFYLAFENSNCQDYVTEKLFDTLAFSEMIPVVYGGGNYTQLFPPKSFINVKDFKSVEDLANYLKYLSQNVNEWLKYFEWRKSYWVSNNRFVLGFCELCNKVLDLRKRKESIIKNNILYWWTHTSDGSGNACEKNQPY